MLPAASASNVIPPEFWYALLLTAFPGMLGGVTNGVSMFLKGQEDKLETWPPNGRLSRLSFFVAQAVTGIGGSIAFLLVTLWAHRFPTTTDEFFNAQSLLTFVCSGFVAGYIANRLLPAIADSLYRQIKKLADQAGAAENTANKAKEVGEQAKLQAAFAEAKTDAAVKLASAMVGALDYLAQDDFAPKKTKEQIDALTELVRLFPTDNNLNLLLARLHAKAAGNRIGAIDVLRTYIQAKKIAGQGEDPEMANAFWNESYYLFAEGTIRKDEDLVQEAVEAMEQSIQREPSYFRALVDDNDFKPMRMSLAGSAMFVRAKRIYEEWVKGQPADDDEAESG